jgi:hypothetical protein
MPRFYRKRKTPVRKTSKVTKKAVKKVVARQRQKKVELKDRISQQTLVHDMYQNGENVIPTVSSVTAGQANTHTIVPSTWSDPFTTGTTNGQIIGTEITPKYLNLKLKMGFDFLRRVVFLGANGVEPHVQRYDITILQGWIKKDLREEMDKLVTNTKSGWAQPAFESKAVYAQALTSIVNQEMFNNAIQPEFLMYRQKRASNIQIIKRIRVKGDMNENLVTDSDAGTPLNSVPANVTPEQNFSFNWNLSKFNKTKLAPLGTGAIDSAEHVLGYSWIPFIQVQVDRRVAENRLSHEGGDPSAPAIPNFGRSYLTLKSVNHFTYSDS